MVMDRTRLLNRRVSEVLHYIWDPIGVADVPEARDEYDDYVPEVVRLAMTNDRVGIISYLEHTSSITMGLYKHTERAVAVADLVLNWKELVLDHTDTHEGTA